MVPLKPATDDASEDAAFISAVQAGIASADAGRTAPLEAVRD